MSDKIEKLTASVRAKVEYPFRVIKREFGCVKVRYRVQEEHRTSGDVIRVVRPVKSAEKLLEAKVGLLPMHA